MRDVQELKRWQCEKTIRQGHELVGVQIYIRDTLDSSKEHNESEQMIEACVCDGVHV